MAIGRQRQTPYAVFRALGLGSFAPSSVTSRVTALPAPSGVRHPAALIAENIPGIPFAVPLPSSGAVGLVAAEDITPDGEQGAQVWYGRYLRVRFYGSSTADAFGIKNRDTELWTWQSVAHGVRPALRSRLLETSLI